MKPLSVTLAALTAVALFTGPVMAQETSSDQMASEELNDLNAPSDAGTDGVEETRYYSEDETTYGVFDAAQGVWNVFESATDTMVGMMPEGEYQPHEPGKRMVMVNRREDGQVGAVARDPGSDMMTEEAMSEESMAQDPMAQDSMAPEMMQDKPMLKAGVAEERYYSDDRMTYAVRGEDRLWTIHDAKTGEPMETTRSYTPNEAGYTVMMPGEMDNVGMGGEAEPTDALPSPENEPKT